VGNNLNVTDTDLRLLRVFKAVVDAGGFSNAQAILDLNPSTISSQMSALESHLGYTLCQRGRSGFKLTERGAALHQYVVKLFHSIKDFQVQADELRSCLSGQLRIGFLDNVISDPDSPLREAISCFVRQRDNQVRLTLDVLGPRELEHGLLEQTLDVAIGIFFNELPGLTYRPLYREREVLVCHRSHRIARISEVSEQARCLPTAAKVQRTFMGEREFPFSREKQGLVVANVTNVEAAAMLILSGEYIGFLPYHYAREWLESDELVVLLPDRFIRFSQFSLVTRDQATTLSKPLQAFVRCIPHQENSSLAPV